MTKEEFIDKWEDLIPEFYHVELAEDLDSVIQQAIAEHEKSKWKKYPDNLPEIGPTYLIQRKGNNIQITSSAYTYWSRLDVIAFRELPAPYQQGGENPFRPQTDSNPKEFKP